MNIFTRLFKKPVKKQDHVKLYDRVYALLLDNKALRDSDRKLMLEVWKLEGIIRPVVVEEWGGDRESLHVITEETFLKGTTPESITRCRRLVQEQHPKLAASISIRRKRTLKEQTKGKFIYHVR